MKNGLVVVLTSNFDAAMLQMAVYMKNEFKKICGDSVVFVPSQAKVADLNGVEKYERKNSIVPFDKQYATIAKRIEAYNPILVYVCDSNLITGRIIVNLSPSIPVFMTVHDVTAHLNYLSRISTVKEWIKSPYIERALKKCNRIVLMSNHSYKGFLEKYPKYSNKLSLIRLGAHVPEVTEQQPTETEDKRGYILFFGRIDKYKGIINLLMAYNKKKSDIKNQLVIAGRGILTEEEQRIISENKESIILIQRYISDAEMIWLFRNAKCTVLPYIEASQSGVLSMSYHFGKPVIVSNLEGLTEFVDAGKTGFIFNTIDELAGYLVSVPERAEKMKEDIARYHDENLNWEKNIRSCLEQTHVLTEE